MGEVNSNVTNSQIGIETADSDPKSDIVNRSVVGTHLICLCKVIGIRIFIDVCGSKNQLPVKWTVDPKNDCSIIPARWYWSHKDFAPASCNVQVIRTIRGLFCTIIDHNSKVREKKCRVCIVGNKSDNFRETNYSEELSAIKVSSPVFA
ncbi:hypothetical protein J6590_037204 [Homalodisca vitripennis]|nr:hypothetical protein J6590_037204 [Homalodisca vitripennis]